MRLVGFMFVSLTLKTSLESRTVRRAVRLPFYRRTISILNILMSGYRFGTSSANLVNALTQPGVLRWRSLFLFQALTRLKSLLLACCAASLPQVVISSFRAICCAGSRPKVIICRDWLNSKTIEASARNQPANQCESVLKRSQVSENHHPTFQRQLWTVRV